MTNLASFSPERNLVRNSSSEYVDLFGVTYQSLNGASTLHETYNFADDILRTSEQYARPIINKRNLYKSDSQEAKYICTAYADGAGDTGYFLKSDCVKLFNARKLGRTYAYAYKKNDDLIKIDYFTTLGGKRTAYFLNYRDIACSGIFKLADSENIPETAREKWFNADAIRTRFNINLQNAFFVSSARTTATSDVFKNLQLFPHRESTIEASENSVVRFQLEGRTCAIYAWLTEENSVLDNWSNDSRLLCEEAKQVRIWNEAEGRINLIHFGPNRFNTMRRDAQQGNNEGNYGWRSEGNSYRIFNFALRELRNTGIYYASIDSAQKDPINAGVNIGACSHCNDLHDLDSHNQTACRQRNMRPSRYEYHSQTPAHQLAHYQQATHIIGVEIEKEDFDGACHPHREIYDAFGWVKERDGSLDASKGYELVSPMFDLFTTALIDEAKAIEAKYPNLINGEYSHACGGHIHYSVKGMTGREALENICGYLPLIYAIYKTRTERTYCHAYEKEQMKYSQDKYQAVRIFSERIEFRIFPAVKNIDTLKWRLDLLRIMAQNPTSNPVEVVNALIDESSDLRKLFERIFDKKTIYKRAVDALKMAKRYDKDFFNIDFSAQINTIEKDAQAL